MFTTQANVTPYIDPSYQDVDIIFANLDAAGLEHDLKDLIAPYVGRATSKEDLYQKYLQFIQQSDENVDAVMKLHPYVKMYANKVVVKQQESKSNSQDESKFSFGSLVEFFKLSKNENKEKNPFIVELNLVTVALVLFAGYIIYKVFETKK